MAEQSVLKNRWVRAALALLIFVGVIVLAWLLSPVLVPLFFAFIAAYVLDPVVDYFEKRGVRRMITTLALAVLGIGIVISVPLYLVTGVVRESQELIQIAQARMTEVKKPGRPSILNEWLHKLPLDELVEALGWAPQPGEPGGPELVGTAAPANPDVDSQPLPETEQPTATAEVATPDGEPAVPAEEAAATGDEPAQSTEEAASTTDEEVVAKSKHDAEPTYDPLAVILERIGTRIQEDSVDLLKNYGQRTFKVGMTASTNVAGVVATAAGTAIGVLLAIGNFVLFAFVAGYLLRDYDRIIAGADSLIPEQFRARVRRIMEKIDDQLRGFMRGQALVCLFLATVYAIGLSIAQVPFGFVIGILGGAASFVPYLGISLTIVPSVVLCIVQQGGFDWHLLVVAATFGFGQMMEATVITPKVVGEQVGLGPVWVILAILVFGNALGLLGLLIAVPMAASLKVLIAEGLVEYKKSKFYRGAANTS